MFIVFVHHIAALCDDEHHGAYAQGKGCEGLHRGERMVRNYCATGKIAGAFLTGKTWIFLP